MVETMKNSKINVHYLLKITINYYLCENYFSKERKRYEKKF